MTELDIQRQNPLVDPHLHIWGWEIPVYLFLGGLAAGVMVASSLLAGRGQSSRVARLLSFAAPLLVAVGMGALFLDLAHKLHVYRFYLAFRVTSPMSWGSWILIAVFPVTVLFSLAVLDDGDAAWLAKWGDKLKLGGVLRKLTAYGRARLAFLTKANLVLGIALGVYTGILLSVMVARPLWNSALLGPLFLTSGVSTGLALLMLFRLPDQERHLLARWDKWAILVELTLLALFLIALVTGGAAGRESAGMLLGGRFTAQFWALVIIAGLLVPLMLDVASERMHKQLAVVAPVLVLVGGFSLRWILVSAGQA